MLLSGSVVELLLSMNKALDFIPTTKHKTKQKTLNDV
jgi:hypothetical protein